MAAQLCTNPSPSVLTPQSPSHPVMHTDEELEASVGTETGTEFWAVWRERGLSIPKSCLWRVIRTGHCLCSSPALLPALPWPCRGLLITLLCFPACPASAFRGETFQSREKITQIKNIFSFFAFPAAHVPFPRA